MMTRLLLKNALVPFLVIALSACNSDSAEDIQPNTGSEVPSQTTVTPEQPTEAPDEPTGSPDDTVDGPNLVIGAMNFDINCSGCHGDAGDNIFRPLNPDNCLSADCTDLDKLASYIDEFMPQGQADACTLEGEDSCALTAAAFIMNGFSTEAASDETGIDELNAIDKQNNENVPTPLARLTNDEYVNSVRTLLSLPEDSPQIEDAKNSLVSESIVRGLSNDAITQTLTQLTVSGYLSMATAAAEDLLGNVTTLDELSDVLNCTVLLENITTNSVKKTCVEEYSKNLIRKAYRRPSTDDDAANIAEIYDNITSLNAAAGNELWDITAHTTTLKAILQFVLLSPEFMLLVEQGAEISANSADKTTLSNNEIATRMALFLAGTLPDEALLADASAGLLNEPAIRLQHANRLMNSDTGIKQFSTLILNWLAIDTSLTDDAGKTAAETFITDWFVNEGIFSDLYQSAVTVEHTDGTISSEPLGILGLHAFVASHTSYPTPSFITRGVFVVEQLLCEALPEDLPDAALDAGQLTPVEVFEVHTKQACATCHRVFDSYGAVFQQFDAETSLFDPSNQEFGSSFELFPIGDIPTTVTSVTDLGFNLGASARASSCMTELWYRHSVRRNIDIDGKDDYELAALTKIWSESDDKSMKALMRAIVSSDSFITLYK